MDETGYANLRTELCDALFGGIGVSGTGIPHSGFLVFVFDIVFVVSLIPKNKLPRLPCRGRSW